MRRLLVLVLVVTAVAGCLGSAPDTGPTGTEAPDRDVVADWQEWIVDATQRGADNVSAPPAVRVNGTPTSRPVVAVIDTGVDPFHEAFRGDAPLKPGHAPARARLAESGERPIYVPATEPRGDETPKWAAQVVEPGKLYRFGGTQLLYYSVLDEVNALDYAGHGTVTSATVLANAPNATVVMVQTDGGHLEDAIAWSIAQPWIDVLSISWGCPLNCAPFYAQDAASQSSWAELADKAHRKGKLWVNSAGNDPTVHWTDETDGPPEMIAVGGAEPDHRAETPDASNLVDVVADWTVKGPENGTLTEYGTHQGTSFAAPTVAGALARTIHELRRRTGHLGGIENGSLVAANGTTLTNVDLRTAMNRTAVYWGPQDYRAPGPDDLQPTDPDDTPAPINPVAPWMQMGWGYVNGSLADEMASGLLDGELPTKPDEARTWMEQRQAMRRRMWS